LRFETARELRERVAEHRGVDRGVTRTTGEGTNRDYFAPPKKVSSAVLP